MDDSLRAITTPTRIPPATRRPARRGDPRAFERELGRHASEEGEREAPGNPLEGPDEAAEGVRPRPAGGEPGSLLDVVC